jgi:hypothetical protein
MSGEYLLWAIKDARLPVLGDTFDYGALSGGRLSAGGWLNSDRTVGVEGSAFLLEQGSADRAAAASLQPVFLPFLGMVKPRLALESHSRL